MTDEISSALPAKPDPKTGEPKPPHAPVLAEYPNRAEPADLMRGPESPVKDQPLLVWRWTSLAIFGRLAALAVALGVGAGAVLQLADVPRSDPANGWLAAFVGVVMGLILVRPRKLGVGAAWLTYGRRWVRTHELTKIEVKPSLLGPVIRLVDPDNNTLTLMLSDLQTNRDLWDYVHLAIRYSLATGKAKANARAIDKLGLRNQEMRS